jgi:hypothetical protein
MAKFATAADSLTTALAIVDSRLTNINIDEQLELYLELIQRRANIQQAIASSSGNTSASAGSDATQATAVQGISGGKPVATQGAQLTYTENQLTAAGQATTVRSKAGYPAISIAYVVALHGSTSVTVRVEVSNDGTNWVNADLTGVDTTKSASGTYGFVGNNQYLFVRFLFVSEAGGTGATIDASLVLGQGFEDGNGLIQVTSSALPTGASTSTLQATTNSNLIDLINTFNPDAFSRLRVSQVTTLADLKQTFDALPLFYDRVVFGAGASTYNAGEASSTLTTAASGDYVIVQSKQRFLYQSGKSTLFILTEYDFHTQTNITKRFGCFSSSVTPPHTANFDGEYLENASGVFSVNVARLGTIVSALQSSWDDKLDGTGASGITIDWTKNQKLVIDYQWLGVGRVRFGFNLNGKIIYFHILEFANSTQKVYMANSNQPVRYEIRQTGAGSGTFTHICASANTEGAVSLLGSQRFINNGNTAVSMPTVGTVYAALGVRLKSTALSSVIDIFQPSILIIDNNIYYRWSLILNPTVAGTFTYADVANSTIQRAIGVTANTVTGGTELYGEFGVFRANTKADFPDALRLGSTIAGVADTLVLCVTPLVANGNYFSSLTFAEYG